MRSALQNITTNRRPGKEEAESLIRQYLQKICDKRNALVKKHSAAVLPKRAENCQTYAAELRTIGITLNC